MNTTVTLPSSPTSTAGIPLLDPPRNEPGAVELGIVLAPGTGPAVADAARRAEERGFGWLVATPGEEADALVTLAFAAGVTDRVRLVAAGVALPGRRAAAVRREAHALDALSGGRLLLGVSDASDGLPLRLTSGAGQPFDAQLDEMHAGTGTVPLLIAGADRRTVERVARVGDGLQLPVGATPYDVATAEAELRDGWHRYYRVGTPRLVVTLAVADVDTLARRVIRLADAGATSVVLTGATGAEHIDVLADALGTDADGSAL